MLVQLSSGFGVLLTRTEAREGATVRKPGTVNSRIGVFAGAAATLIVYGCAVDVDHRESIRTVRAQTPVGVFKLDRPSSPAIDLPVYPRANRTTPRVPVPPAVVSFTGRFADIGTRSSHFATHDGVDLVLQFYRDVMRTYSALLECRGTINVRARGRTEELRCIDRGTSDSVQLAVSMPSHHAVVSVKPAGTGSTFTVVNVRTRH